MTDKRTRIIEASIEVFEAKGYHDSKISEIAKKAEIGKGTVYEYFESKESLFEEMIIHIIDMYFEITEKRLSAITHPEEMLRVLTDMDWEVTKNHWQLMNVILSRLANLSPDLQMRFYNVREKSLQTIESILTSGIESGLFIKHDTRLLALMYKGTFSQATMDLKMKAIATCAPLTDEVYHEMTDKIYDIFLENIRV